MLPRITVLNVHTRCQITEPIVRIVPELETAGWIHFAFHNLWSGKITLLSHECPGDSTYTLAQLQGMLPLQIHTNHNTHITGGAILEKEVFCACVRVCVFTGTYVRFIRDCLEMYRANVGRVFDGERKNTIDSCAQCLNMYASRSHITRVVSDGRIDPRKIKEECSSR